jgi:hypothetical protein
MKSESLLHVNRRCVTVAGMVRHESQTSPKVAIGLPLAVTAAAAVYLGFTDSWRFAIALAIFGFGGGIISVLIALIVARRRRTKGS